MNCLCLFLFVLVLVLPMFLLFSRPICKFLYICISIKPYLAVYVCCSHNFHLYFHKGGLKWRGVLGPISLNGLFFKWTHSSFSHDFWSCLLEIDVLKLQKHDLEYCHCLSRVDNCLQSLVGILTGNKIELQEQVAWCLTNVASGRPEHALAVAKAAAPYFITYVSGSSPLLQVLVQGCGCMCVWCARNHHSSSLLFMA